MLIVRAGATGAVVLAALAVASCGGGAAAPSGPLDQTVLLAHSGSTRIDDAGMTLRFDQVIGDSRCPIDGICIQGGDAIVQITVLPFDGQPARYELHTASPSSAAHGPVTLTLEELTPYPFSSRPFPPSEYRARVRLTR